MGKQDFTIKLSDRRVLGYTEYGDPKGKPVFYFHGWPSSRLHGRVFDEVGKKLTVRIISMDRPGIGLSDYKKDRTLLDFPDDVVELADKLKINKFAVMGVSGGGPYAAACAYKIPDRLTKVGIVVGLAPVYIKGLLEGEAWINKLAWGNFYRFPWLRQISSFLGWLESNYLHTFFATNFSAKQDQVLNTPEFKKAHNISRAEAFKHGWKAAAMDLKLYSTDWGFDMKKIEVSVFLFYGEADKNVSLEMGKYYASQIPGSKLTIYPNEGHFAQLTHAEEILNSLTDN